MKVQKKKAIVCGHICLDITPLFGSQKCKQLSELFIPGKLIHMEGVDVHVGGCVANTGLGMKCLGADVSLMGKVGSDAFGELILASLEKWGCRDQMLVCEESGTSYSVVLAPEGIDRIFLHDSGMNDSFSINDLDFNEIAKADLFHLGYPTLMRMMYQNDGEQLVKILKQIHDMGVATSLDMAAIDPASDAAKEDWERILKNILPYVDYFVPSAEELAFMMDRKLLGQWEKRAEGKDLAQGVCLETDLTRLSDQLLSWGAKVVLIKCGNKGLYLRTAERSVLSKIGKAQPAQLGDWSGLEVFEECFTPKRVCSGTGAGDTTIAAFLTAMMSGHSWQKTMKLASGTGASCVETFDALSGLKSFESLEQKMKEGWKKQKVLLPSWEYSQQDQCWIHLNRKGIIS